MYRAIIILAVGMALAQSSLADIIKLQKFKSAEQGQKITNQFAYAMASLDRGIPTEAEKVLENILYSVSYDRRLYGYTRVAITYFQLGKVADARAVIQKILNSLTEESNQTINKAILAASYLKARKYQRADNVLEELAFECGMDRKNILREINIARAALAVQQYVEADIQVDKIVFLLRNENREDAGVFEFSLDAELLDAIAGAEAR